MTRILLLLMLAATAPLGAQQHRSGHDDDHSSQMARMQEMMMPMRSAMAYSPEHLLARKDSLKLTASQIIRLTVLQDVAKRAHDAAHDDAKAHMNDMTPLFDAANPDTAALKTHFDATHAAMGKAHWAMLAAAAQARTVLTDEQRARVERGMHRMKEHTPGHH